MSNTGRIVKLILKLQKGDYSTLFAIGICQIIWIIFHMNILPKLNGDGRGDNSNNLSS